AARATSSTARFGPSSARPSAYRGSDRSRRLRILIYEGSRKSIATKCVWRVTPFANGGELEIRPVLGCLVQRPGAFRQIHQRPIAVFRQGRTMTLGETPHRLFVAGFDPA